MICVHFHYTTKRTTRSVSASSRLEQKEPRRKAWQFLNSHVPRARNFTVGNQLPPEDSLANCHRQFSPQKNRWSALRAASEKAARSGDRFRFSSDLVRFYNQVRTYFQQNL